MTRVPSKILAVVLALGAAIVPLDVRAEYCVKGASAFMPVRIAAPIAEIRRACRPAT
jgi:hypothetical protein